MSEPSILTLLLQQREILRKLQAFAPREADADIDRFLTFFSGAKC